jgi:hypothetical protein
LVIDRKPSKSVLATWSTATGDAHPQVAREVDEIDLALVLGDVGQDHDVRAAGLLARASVGADDEDVEALGVGDLGVDRGLARVRRRRRLTGGGCARDRGRRRCGQQGLTLDVVLDLLVEEEREGGDEGDAEQRQAEQDAEDAQAPARAAPLAAGAGVGGVVPLGSRVLTDVWHRSSLGASATGPCPRPRWAGAGGRPRGIQ